MAVRAEARRRRYDPDRRSRLIEAALVVLARDGVAAITHRSVAQAADVPVSATTYHFTSLEALVTAAFERHVDRLAARFENRMVQAADAADAVAALVASITTDLTASPAELALTYELYGAAVRRPAVKAITESWMARAEAALCAHFDAATARALDALLEGFMVHVSIASHPVDEADIRAAFTQLLGNRAGQLPTGPNTH